MNDCRKCKYFVPNWKGNSTSMSAPAWCLKRQINLTSNTKNWKGCKNGKEAKR